MMNYIIILLIVLLLLSFFVWSTIYITKHYLEPKNKLEEMKIKNDKYNLFSTLSIEAINQYLDDYFEGYIQKYISMRFMVRKITYIKEEACETMVRDITKVIAFEISELYIFYIKMVYNISTDEDLLKFINSKVKIVAVEQVSAYNSSTLS